MKIYLSYGNYRMRKTQQLNGKKIAATGFFDKLILTSFGDLDKEFVNKYKQILKYRRLGGYAVWKPYIIKKTLLTLKKDDVLCYVDADFYFTNPIDPVIETMLSWKQPIMPFNYKYGPSEKYWTKRDAFIIMGLDGSQFTDTPQIVSGISLWQAGSAFALKFLDEWMNYAGDKGLITDVPSRARNYPGFVEHRHDQSLFSLLCKKYDLKPLPFPREGWDEKGDHYRFLARSDLRINRWTGIKRMIFRNVIYPNPLLRYIHQRGFRFWL